LASVVTRLTVPDSTWTMVTSAPVTGWPSGPVTTPLRPAEVLWAKAGAAASATIRPSDSFESRTRCLGFMFNGLDTCEREWRHTLLCGNWGNQSVDCGRSVRFADSAARPG